MGERVLEGTSSRTRHRGQLSVPKLLALALFILVGTHFEFPNDASGAGLGFAIRLAAAAYVLAYMYVREHAHISHRAMLTTFTICAYFLAVNVPDFTYFAAMGIGAIAWGLLMSSPGSQRGNDAIVLFCTCYLAFHMSGLGLAIVIRLATGTFIDLHNLVFPFSESRIGESGGLFRLAGFHVEPGSYTNFVYLLVLLRSLYMGRIFSWLNAAAMASTLLTLAAWSAIGCGAFALAAIVEFSFFRRLISPFFQTIIIFGCLSLVIVLPSLLDFVGDNEYIGYFSERYYGSARRDSSREDKILAFDSLQEAIPNAIFVGNPLPHPFCPICLSPQDLGTLLNMAYYFGIIPTVFLIAFAIRNVLGQLNGAFIIFAAPLIVNKAYFFEPLIWLIFGAMLSIDCRQRSAHSDTPANRL